MRRRRVGVRDLESATPRQYSTTSFPSRCHSAGVWHYDCVHERWIIVVIWEGCQFYNENPWFLNHANGFTAPFFLSVLLKTCDARAFPLMKVGAGQLKLWNTFYYIASTTSIRTKDQRRFLHLIVQYHFLLVLFPIFIQVSCYIIWYFISFTYHIERWFFF